MDITFHHPEDPFGVNEENWSGEVSSTSIHEQVQKSSESFILNSIVILGEGQHSKPETEEKIFLQFSTVSIALKAFFSNQGAKGLFYSF